MRPASTNTQITAAALLLLLCCLSFRDLIPKHDGIGYDGKYYALWVRTISIGDLVDVATAETRAEKRDAIWLDSYRVRRMLPSMLVRGALAGLKIEPTNANIIVGFTAANIALLVLSVFLCCRSADSLGIGPRATRASAASVASPSRR